MASDCALPGDPVRLTALSSEEAIDSLVDAILCAVDSTTLTAWVKIRVAGSGRGAAIIYVRLYKVEWTLAHDSLVRAMSELSRRCRQGGVAVPNAVAVLSTLLDAQLAATRARIAFDHRGAC